MKKEIKRILCVVLTMAIVLPVSCVAVFAEKADISVLPNSGIHIQNVRFISDNEEAYVLPAAGEEVLAEVVITNATKETAKVTILLAAYGGDGNLTDVKLSRDTDVVEIMPTVKSSNVAVGENTTAVKLFVWDKMDSMQPITANEYALSDTSRDNSITDFSIEVGGNTYKGLVNDDLKSIRVYVPTAVMGDWNGTTANNDNTLGEPGLFNAKTGGIPTKPSVSTVEGFGSCLETDFTAALTSIAPVVSTSGTVAESGARDFTTPKTYTVTAANGEEAVYTADISSLSVQYLTDFKNVKLGTMYTNAEIPTLTDELTTAPFSTGEWTNNGFVAADKRLRTGMFIGGQNGGGSWRFFNRGSVILQDHTSDTSAMKIGFSPESPIKMGFDSSDGSDGKESGDRYGVITYGFRAGSTESGGTTGISYNVLGMEARQTLFYAFDFNLKNNTGTGFVRLQSPYYQAILAPTLQARAHVGDNNFTGKTATSYTSLYNGRADEKVAISSDDWHKLAIISRALDEGDVFSVAGKQAVMTEFYLDGKYIGYVFSNDREAYTTDVEASPTYNLKGLLSTKKGNYENATAPTPSTIFDITHSNKTYVNFCLDNLVFGTPYQYQTAEPEPTE